MCGSIGWQHLTEGKYLFTSCGASQSYTYWYTKKSQPQPGPPINGCYGSSFFNISQGEAPPDCLPDECNSMCLLFNTPPPGTLNVGLGINGRGADPYGQIEIRVTRTVYQPQRYTIFHSFYEEMEKNVQIPSITTNLFIDLAERIASSLNVTNCYVCGGTNMGERWPWEAREIKLATLSQMNLTWSSVDRPREWILQTSIIGAVCFQRPASQLFVIPLGDLVCQNLIVATKANTTWWSGSNATQPKKPFSAYRQLSSIWDHLHDVTLSWPAPDGLLWICG